MKERALLFLHHQTENIATVLVKVGKINGYAMPNNLKARQHAVMLLVLGTEYYLWSLPQVESYSYKIMSLQTARLQLQPHN